MMNSSELRREARNHLAGKRGKAGGTYLIYFLITLGISLFLGLIPLGGQLVSFIITPALLYGCVTVLMRIRRGEDVKASGCISEGFEKIGKVLCCNLWISLELLLWSFLLVISISLIFVESILTIIGIVLTVFSAYKLIVKSVRFSLVNFLIYDNPELRSKDIVNKSEEIMKQNGNVGRLILLNLSFIGWILLLGVGIYLSMILLAADIAASMLVGFSGMAILGIIGYILVLFFSLFYLTPYIQMANICFYEELCNSSSIVENNEYRETDVDMYKEPEADI